MKEAEVSIQAPAKGQPRRNFLSTVLLRGSRVAQQTTHENRFA